MTGELAAAVISGAVKRAVKAPVLLLPLELAVSVRAPARQREKTFTEAHEKKHRLAEWRDRADFEVVDLAAIYFTRAWADNLGRFRAVRLNLIAMAVRIVDIHASFAHGAKFFAAVL